MPQNSLKGKKEIQALLKTGRRYSSGRLAVYLDRTRPDFAGNFKVAYLLSAKSGSAAVRNRIRRWLKEDFRRLQKEKSVNGAFIVRLKCNDNEGNQLMHNDLTRDLENIYEAITADG